MQTQRLMGLVLGLLLVTVNARAQNAQIVQGGSVQLAPPQILVDAPVEQRPSVFAHSLQGMLAGALVGTGVGYLAAYDSDEDPAAPVLMGTAIGALTGAGIGLSLGLLDLSDDYASPVRYVARDMLYGTAVGGLFGTIGGSIVVLDGGDGDDVLAGASIGAISGVVLGALVGVIEGQWRKPTRTRRVTTTISVSQDETGKRVVMPGIAGRF